MPLMKRNRNIRTLSLHNLNLLKHPLPEASDETAYFGEEIAQTFKENNLSSDDSVENILTGLRDLGNSKSSSSSLSWGEEYKNEASKQLRDELERMDRVLRGFEPIPDNYDQEEYQEWMECFPNLCVLGTKTGSCPVVNCDKVATDDQIDKAVIKVTPDFSADYLKISPLGGATSRLSKRQSSSRSLISSHISSSKWLKDDEYTSLPFVSATRITQNGAPRGILKNTLVLPPIDGSQFRSISATPRRETKISKYSVFRRK